MTQQLRSNGSATTDANASVANTNAESERHGLTHALCGDRLVPACLCGWWSPDGSHWRYERHVRTAHLDTAGGPDE